MTGGASAYTVQAMAVCAGSAAWLAAVRDPGARRASALFMGGAATPRLPWEGLDAVRAFVLGRREWWSVPVAVVLAALGESVLPLLAGAVAVPLVRRWLRARSGRRDRERSAEAVAALCGAVVGELRAGREPGQALLAAVRETEGSAGAMGGAEAAVLAAARFGGDVAGALRQAADGPGLGGLVGMAACWRVAVDGGAGLAAGLDRLEGALRAERRRREELRAQLAGAWSTVVVLALLPVAGLGLGAALGADPLGVLLHSAGGLVCLAVGGALEAAGLFWANRIVRGGEAA
ncbi:type II secretion system F family protein [Streptomyces sp. BE147]|uniref:type II secretion system F family protein n=1 Tax=Streptomyces sp. BE147 TaxID=3002524 RepID=UPI002E76292E|nr:type II secretion system F family protein [Streptomyces sp. BE147]MEE1738051.1 type II secretion system F family protein [Streptomyces sp. BE147]